MNSACFYPLRQRFDEESFRFGLRIVKTVGSDTFEPRKTPVQQRSTVTVEAISEATIQVLLAVGLDRLTATRVAAPAIPKCTNHLCVLKTVREPEFKPTLLRRETSNVRRKRARSKLAISSWSWNTFLARTIGMTGLFDSAAARATCAMQLPSCPETDFTTDKIRARLRQAKARGANIHLYPFRPVP